MRMPVVFHMEYHGPVVPHVRVGRERWTARAKKYRASQDALGWAFLASARACGVPEGGISGAWEVELSFHRSAALGDLDNLAKAALDSANGIIWSDDRMIVKITATLERCKKGEDRVIVDAQCNAAP